MRPLPIIESDLPPVAAAQVAPAASQETNLLLHNPSQQQQQQPNSIVAVHDEALPSGWERVIDQTHGTYYIDHNTQRTQYERPYEIELTKGSMGFGFTLVETDGGLLLVRSVIPGGPAYSCGLIRPGDILVSAVGVSVSGLAHTGVARLFSTFAVGDRVRLTFARSQYVVDSNLVPDEYLFSNGTNGDLAVALNSEIYGTHPNPQAVANSIVGASALPLPPPSQFALNGAQNYQQIQPQHLAINQQEFDFINVVLKRGDKGFGFTIGDSTAGQKVRVIQNNDVCANLKQGDILVSINGQDITKMTHQQVVEELKRCPAGEDVSLLVRRKRRFRSKTPAAMRSESNGEFPQQHNLPQRNCKTPNVDSLMLRNVDQNQNTISRTLFAPAELPNAYMPTMAQQLPPIPYPIASSANQPPVESNYESMHRNNQQVPPVIDESAQQSIYGAIHQQPQPPVINDEVQNIYGLTMSESALGLPTLPAQSTNPFLQPMTHQQPVTFIQNGTEPLIGLENDSSSVNPSEVSLPPIKFANVNGISNMNHYNNFMYNDKLMMMQMQQQQQQQQQQVSQYQPILTPPNQPSSLPVQTVSNSDYQHVPLYSNSEIIKSKQPFPLQVPPKPAHSHQYLAAINQQVNSNNNNYYANNEEIALQQMQYETRNGHQQQLPYAPHMTYQPYTNVNGYSATNGNGYSGSNGINGTNGFHQYTEQLAQLVPMTEADDHDSPDDYGYHQVDLDRDNTDSKWGIRLIGGAEVERAISIGSIVFGGAASKDGRLKSGDEIVSINGINVVGETHQHVVELISACKNQASLVVRRKKFAEACEVVLTKNSDEGFGFVMISSGNCALIGRIIEGSPADRCQQLHVRDRIIAVNGRYITPNMQHPEIVNMIKECGSTLRLRIVPVDCYTVELIKSVQSGNFGFSMRGGAEFDGMSLYILRVAPDGLAKDLLNVGDQIIEINGIPTVGMTHQQAATIIKGSDPIVKLKLRRKYLTLPSLSVVSPRVLQKFNQVTAEMKTVNSNTTSTSSNHQDDGPALVAGESNSSDSDSPFTVGSSSNNLVQLGDANLQPQSHLTFNDQQQQQVDVNSNQICEQPSSPLCATL